MLLPGMVQGQYNNNYWVFGDSAGVDWSTIPPTFFNSMSELEAFVAQTPGAIGVVKKEASNEGKLIAIDGKKEF